MNFFDRLQALRQARPHPAILTVRSENSDYCPYHANGRNSYLIIGHNMAEDCLYGFWVGFSQDCFGCVSRNHAEYEILNEKYTKDEYFKRVAEIKEQLKREGSYGRWWWPSPYGEIAPTSSYMAG